MRGVEVMDNNYHLLDLTAYGRQEKWEDSPAGWPQQCTYTRTSSGSPTWEPVCRRTAHRPVAATRSRTLRRPGKRQALKREASRHNGFDYRN